MSNSVHFTYDEVVIGCDLSATIYAYTKKVPIIYTRQIRPYKYLDKRNYEEDSYKYNYYLFMLGLIGMLPFSDKVQSIRLEDGNTLKVSTKHNYLVTITFNKLVISDDYKVEGLPGISGKSTYDNYVTDLFGMDERNVLPDVIEREERVVKKILYNKRVTRRLRQRFINVISIMTDEELKQVEFSEKYINFRLCRLFDHIKVFKHHSRETYSMGKNLYDLPDNIKILTENPTEIEQMVPSDHYYMKFLESVIWSK